MPDFRPFRGIRYNPERFGTDLSSVAAPPYDVIDEDRLAHLRSQHDRNAVHLTLPEDGDAGQDRYAHAAELLRSWLDDGTLVVDDQPRLFLYRVGFEDEDGHPRQTTGVIGALEVVSPGDGDVLPHERTMPKPRGDRLDLLRATRANLEPIWGLSLADGLSELLEPDGPPLTTCTDTRGAHHRLYAIDAPARIDAISRAIGGAPVVIADGHHRYETSLHYRAERAEQGDDAGEHDRIMTLVVELADDQLAVQPIHRVVEGLGDGADLRAALAEDFDLIAAGPNEPDVIAALGNRLVAEGAMALVDADGVALMTPRPGALDARLVAGEPELVHGVDAARFEVGVAPLLEARRATVTYRHDRAAVAELVRKGAADAAVVLRPVDVPTIRAVAEARERMPQKTTFFHPKPSTGLVLRSLDR